MDDHKPKTASINDFREWKERGELVLQPRFQRREVWTQKSRSYLIDTILRKFPIPAIYIRQKINLPTQKTVREVVDGQQRIGTILKYINDKFTVSSVHNKRYGNMKFSELPDDVKKSFLEYDISIDFLIGATDADVLDVFSRINSYTVVLNPQEKINAKWNGEFKQTVFKLGREHLEFWRQNRVLTDYSITRMKEAELCTDLVIAMIGGIQDRKKVNSYYKIYDDSFPQKEEVVNQFHKCIDKIAEIFNGALPESEFRRTTLFYSFFCVIYDLSYGIPNRNTQRIQIKKDMYISIRKALTTLENEILSTTTSPEYSQFKDAATSHTTDQSKRIIRHDVILNEILKELEAH